MVMVPIMRMIAMMGEKCIVIDGVFMIVSDGANYDGEID